MKKAICFILSIVLCAAFAGCESSSSTGLVVQYASEETVKVEIEKYLLPQVNAYKKAFEIEDLSIDVQFSGFDVYKPQFDSAGKLTMHGSVYCRVREILVSPSLSQKLQQGEFTDEMLKQLSAIEFSYPNIVNECLPWGNYELHPYSALTYPIFADEEGTEYTVSDGILLRGDIIAYISPDAHLEIPAKVGDNVKEIVRQAASAGSDDAAPKPSGTKCPNCKGSGYVKYHYGSSDLQAYLEGHDPYTVGKCTTCQGKGYY